ncbi:type I restriction endonuclease subunit R [Chloroflexales bacterium ZM16-3]|nr:type I restriction endonuclease subunit R [Chloroflexales bacterium ZM16-3]
MDTSERDFETTVVAVLTGIAPGSLVRERGVSYGDPPLRFVERPYTQYDRALGLDPGALFDFLYTTQPQTWAKLQQQHGEALAKERFLKRLVKEIATRGTLDILRKGVVDMGCSFSLAYFRPETGLNAEHQRRYRANLLSVTRQVRYSLKNENSLDLVLFLNGLPIITAELKNPLKQQTVEHAVRQYRQQRDPKEPLFALGRCLAHFAVDTDLVYMATHLRGKTTVFLPFNQGRDNGAGNPDNPNGFKTAYLWEEVWQPDSLLEIIDHFVQHVPVKDAQGKPTGAKRLIFPRYHQLEVVRRLIGHTRAMGAGQNYLIQHSAGSGKSNSIAWLCYRLAGLHDANDARVFDSIVVITDRRVLDKQLRDTVSSFEQVKGLVKAIEANKAQELAQALEVGRAIIITTLQTFPFVVQKIGTLPGKRFAIVVDEAHSSQSGEGSKALKQVLATASLETAAQDEAPEEDQQDAVNTAVETAMRQRQRLPNLSFFAWTATPKGKTLELFGVRRPDGSYAPFHLYSMRQAIQEGFILDVLQNYTTFKVYFNLHKRIEDDPQYDKPKALALLKAYADLHEHAIRTKTVIMVEHFHAQVRHRIGGQAKAMVVTRSRLHAVRYKQAFDRYLQERGYPYRALVAFSGAVRDPDTQLEFTETEMNGVPESQTAETFKQAPYRFLIVAEKFQTGFDQPLLHTMYVDKKLSGVNAVQTLSRLNRIHPEKEDTFVLDLANDAEEIQEAFQPFYQAAVLSEGTDPNKLYDLQRILEEYRLYTRDEVAAFAQIYFARTGKQEQLHPILNPVVDRYIQRSAEEQADFRTHLRDYVRLYAFLAQVITFVDADLEKLYQWARHLVRKLPVTRDELPVEITENVNMASYRIQQTSTGEIKLLDEDGALQPISDLGTGRPTGESMAPLSAILAYLNEHFGTAFSDADKVGYFADDMERRLSAQAGLGRALDPTINPSPETRRLAFDSFFGDALEDMIDANFDIYKKIVDDADFGTLFRAFMFDRIEQGLRGGAMSSLK